MSGWFSVLFMMQTCQSLDVYGFEPYTNKKTAGLNSPIRLLPNQAATQSSAAQSGCCPIICCPISPALRRACLVYITGSALTRSIATGSDILWLVVAGAHSHL